MASNWVWMFKMSAKIENGIVTMVREQLKDSTALGIQAALMGKWDKAIGTMTTLSGMVVVAPEAEVVGKDATFDDDGKELTPAIVAKPAITGVNHLNRYIVILEKNNAALPHLDISAFEMRDWAIRYVETYKAMKSVNPTLLRDMVEDAPTTTTTKAEKPEY